jgi:small subunit ribosomal protein S1
MQRAGDAPARDDAGGVIGADLPHAGEGSAPEGASDDGGLTPDGGVGGLTPDGGVGGLTPDGGVGGLTPDGDEPAEGEEGGPAEGAAASPGAGEPHAEGQGEKKRRRRRRKKKPGAGGADARSTESPQSPDATGEAPAEEGAEAKPGPGGDRREKRKEKKHAGPPRERPPVNIGDIIFGKIIEITDDAILIDIPGKAHAIFDRREMLLTDDDDEPAPRPAAREPEPDAGNAPDAPASPEEEASAAGAEEPEAEAETSVDAAAEAPTEVSAPAEDAEVAALPAPPATNAGDATPPAETSGTEAPAPEAPPREPKVPRVILEVGADFIGVVHNDGARGGLVVLTHHPKRAERAKAHIEKAFNEKTTLDGLVTGVIKGGVEVDVDGLRAFAPGSHVDVRLGADLSHLLAKRLPFFVTQYAKRGRDVVLSRKSMIEEEARRARAEALAKLKVGEDLDGVVRSVVPFGAFVDVGGVEGLVPLQEMSHNRSDGPSDVFKAGEPTRVRVIKIDDKGKIWLSRKATIPDPWQEVARKYAQRTRHTGKVVRLQPFGAFVELEPGIDGLIHTSDLSIKRIESPEEVVKVGDTIEVVVSHVDPSNHKIALHPAPQGAAADEAPQRVVLHKPVKAKIVNIESGGLVVRVLGVTGRNARGYITAAGTGTPRGTELRKAFNIGQDVEAKVVEVDPRRGEVKLSIKALSEEQERSAYQQYRQQLKAEAKFTFADLLAKKKN